MARKIGLFGGTFDPIHLGHLRVAEEVAEVRVLSRVLFVPNRVPPHKEGVTAPARSRLHMVRAAISGNRLFDVSDFELKQDGPSYTLHTLAHFRALYGPKADLVFILGTDAFAEIGTWHEAETVLAMADFVVMPRPGTRLKRLPSVLPRSLARSFAAAGEPGDEGASWRHDSGRMLYRTPVTCLDVSASDIRARVACGRSIRYLVPEPVRAYIRRNRLYRATADSG